MLKEPINIGVIGVGHLGQHHVKHYKSIEDANLIGIFDIDNDRAKKIGNKYYSPRGKSVSQLLTKLGSGEIKKINISGCILEKINNSFVIYKEK